MSLFYNAVLRPERESGKEDWKVSLQLMLWEVSPQAAGPVASRDSLVGCL